jgi:hypothetical protein
LFISNSNGTFFVKVETRGALKKLRTMMTFSHGSSWTTLCPPRRDAFGEEKPCDATDAKLCGLHFHSVTALHNFGRVFSSRAPGFVMGVGSNGIGESLWEYKSSDTFLSTDAGLSWQIISKGAHKYEFGDLGSILVMVDDEEITDSIRYSSDLGKTW